MTIEVDTVTLPSYWASALVNGDDSGLEDNEIAMVEAACGRLAADGWYVVDVARDDDGNGEDARFTWSYQLYCPEADCSGGDVLDYVVHRTK